MTLPIHCPVCTLEEVSTHEDRYECVTCGHEWPLEAASSDDLDAPRVVKDAHGNLLVTGDDVILVKDLKLKGSSTTLKGGTKVRRIRIVAEGDHEVDCKVDGMSVMLKACFLKKA
ncbi:MAG: zinc ribbon domain-containing protein YjdM [Deltaproteobacteria bacterium]|nr:zinc ribbon domain-containing protein YjdM [Deltaproteobacteria bacterium]